MFIRYLFFCWLGCLSFSIQAAERISLLPQDTSALQKLLIPFFNPSNPLALKETRRSEDFKHTLHIRLQETYRGYPIWGAETILHFPNQGGNKTRLATLIQDKNSSFSLSGHLYPTLEKELPSPPPHHAPLAQQIALQHAQQHFKKTSIYQSDIKLMILIKEKVNQASWAYLITFLAPGTQKNPKPAKLHYLIEAKSLHIHQYWDEIPTLNPYAMKQQRSKLVKAGGLGGNKKLAYQFYDGLAGHFPFFYIKRIPIIKRCYLANSELNVQAYAPNREWANFHCATKAPEHNHIYWNRESDEVNGGYSPSNDVYFNGLTTLRMFQTIYGIPPLLENDGTPKPLNLVVHIPEYENAYWDGDQLAFGDGAEVFYPLTSLDIVAHEIGHGFTSQQSQLVTCGEAGALNEAFSDMTAKAAEFYLKGQNTWTIGADILKKENIAYRYMDQPSKDCYGKAPGDECSIDHVSQFDKNLSEHFACGVYNRFFYLLSTSPGWDAQKAFGVMLQANKSYWTYGSSFIEAACGVLKAAKDYQYSTQFIIKAFESVGILTKECETQ